MRLLLDTSFLYDFMDKHGSFLEQGSKLLTADRLLIGHPNAVSARELT